MDDPQRGRWREAFVALRALHLYGAAALASFGFVVTRWLHFEPSPWVGLWFAGSLFAYNLDRLATDPADAINTPRRVAHFERLRKISAALAGTALFALVLVPLLRHDWLLLSLVITGALVCSAYSFTIRGRRLKRVPRLKTFLVPSAVTATLLVPPMLQAGLRMNPSGFLCATAAVWSFLFFNVLLCDMRDIEGDRQTGTFSLPVRLGARRTRRLLAVVLAATAALCLSSGWPLFAACCVIYMGALLAAVRHPRPEPFYEWWVEGMLFLPAAACLLHAAGWESV